MLGLYCGQRFLPSDDRAMQAGFELSRLGSAGVDQQPDGSPSSGNTDIDHGQLASATADRVNTQASATPAVYPPSTSAAGAMASSASPDSSTYVTWNQISNLEEVTQARIDGYC